MASSNGFFTSSPTVVLPPTQPDQYFANSHYATDATNGHLTNGLSDAFTPNGSIPPTPGSMAGRKRSRADINDEDEEQDGIGDGSVETPITQELKRPRGKPIYGPGMTLIYPEDPGYEARPESQSGTWVEEDEQRKAFQNAFPPAHGKRPSISQRKSVRVDSTASAPDDLAQLVLPPQMREVTTEPLIDEATRVLGISWTRMDATEATRISQPAYSKWIQNHYPSLKDVSVWFENSAIPGYLVAAQNAYTNQQEYYIFSQDLKEARQVTSDPTQLIPRLQMLPALELAAPGGHISAEKDATPEATPVSNDQSEVNSMQGQTPAEDPDIELMRQGILMQAGMFRGFCSAHEMDLD